MKQYNVNVFCKNCKASRWITEVPVGKTLKEFCVDNREKCGYCGCEYFPPQEDKSED